MSSRSALRSRRKRSPKTFHATERRLSHQTLERRELLAGELGPQLISVSANSGENFRLTQQNILRESPTQLTFRFDGSQQLDASTLAAISVHRSGGDGSFAEGNEIRIDPGFLGFGDSQRIIVARFAESLPDDTYQISIAGYDDTNAGIVGLRNSDGELLRVAGASDPARPEQRVQFRIELGPQVVAVVPQPVTGTGSSRTQHRNQIYVYFNEDPLSNPALGVINTASSSASVVRPEYYNLFFTDDKVENTAHQKFNPSSVTYNPALNRAVLTFAAPGNDISNLIPGGSGTFRLRVGSAQDLPAAPLPVNADLTTDIGDTFNNARNLGVNFNANPQSILISGEIEPAASYPIQWPGLDTPGTRDHRRDAEVIGRPDSTPGINVYYYNFADAYGLDPFGNVLDNAITDAQRQRTREILALYSQHLGVQFIETENRGLQIVTGDLRALVRPAITGPGEPLHEFRLNDEDPSQGVLVLDSGENWYDGYGLSPDGRPSWFVEALRGIGSLLGIGNTFDQVPGVASGSNPALYNPGMFLLPDGTVPTDFSIEPDFLSTSDIIPGQALHRPEIRDVDLYRFDVAADGRISIETFAQRLDETSTLDTEITLWKFNPVNNRHEIAARNDDFYSNDSFIGVDVSPNVDGTPARYYIGITAKGNDSYNPDIANSGLGGRTQGLYDMRITFQNTNVDTIRDVNGTALDGDGNGVPGGDFNFWFRTAKSKGTEGSGESRTLFVDKSGVNNTSAGTLVSPYRTIGYAFSQARPGDIVRILPSAGVDGLIDTVGDNLAYEIGRGGPSNAILSDGETFNVPRGVTVMIDAGTIIKLRNAKISVGSSRIDDDRSLAALQILGTPVLLDHNGVAIGGEVVFTSYQDESFGTDTNPLPTSPAPGQWAGIEFRNDFDYSEGRPVWETEGIFLDYVAHADIRYGGGSISPTEPIVNPLQMLDARPTILHNTIQFSSDAAISADPNSFAETNFHAPIYQRVESFTSDYDRVGPDIRGNRLVDNSINGLFVRVQTPAAGQREPMTVSGRFDDFDITHVISEVLVLQGQPGGPVLSESRPDVLGVTLTANPNPAPPTGTLTPGTVVNYRITFVTRDGVESLASTPTGNVTVGANRNIRLANLPQATEEYAGRRLYRLDASTGNYVFVTQLDRNTTSYTDTGRTRGGLLSGAAIAAATSERLIPRFDARLSIDPGLVIKLDSARIEAGVGADFYAEGIDGKPVVFTSRLDDEYGAGGTFDTNNDGDNGVPQAGAWAGLVFRQGSTASLDHTIVRYAGGGSSVSGGFATFNPVEILQADVRIANSLFVDNASGNSGNLDFRDGIGFNGAATIFVRGAQPTIVDNIIRDNLGAAISINPDSLNYTEVQDKGRSTGNVDLIEGRKNNQGALIAGNRLDGNTINGMLIRQEALTTESVWDDTDIVHVLQGQVYAWNHHHRGGLRLKSAADESLVVKSFGNGGITAARYLNDVEDSIGGTLQVIGTPGFPVVMTSVEDCSVGAGFTPSGLPQNDTLNSGLCSVIDVDPSAPFVDVIVVMDESGSMGFVQDFSAQFILDLEAGLLAAGIGVQGGNRYGAVGFGIIGPGNEGRSILVGGDLFGTAAEYAAATAEFSTFGAVEDGYAGINFALQNYAFRPNAAKFIVLATDEPRAIVDRSLNLAGTISALQAADVTVVGVLGVNIFDNNNNLALAIDNREVYTETPTGFSREPGGQIRGGLSAADYVPLVTQTDGITGDLDFIGISDESANKFSQVLIQSVVSSVVNENPAEPGDWLGIRIAPGANDRNVAFVLETEPAVAEAAGLNAIPATSQVIGSLATNEYSADENRRLGFNVRGTLSSNNDIDVYSFFANGQTEVYIDIDDTHFGLDSVVELIDVNGNILALSNDSDAESVNRSLLVNNIGAGAVLPLFKTGQRIVEGPNTLDAGMRVLLPGNSNSVNQYFVRVRSSNLAPGDARSKLVNPNALGQGRSQGQYQLAVRLRESDEIAGTTVRLADIRYATNAIDVSSSPFDSPLAAEFAERLQVNGLDVDGAGNFTNAGAQNLGSLNSSHRNVLRVSGFLGNNVANPASFAASQDIDVYRVDLFDERLGPEIIGENRFVTAVFDIDYADQLARANTRLSIFDAAGRLILHGLNSNVADDQGRPRLGNDMNNLGGGSAGTLDSYIGPVELQQGTYYVVVSNAQMTPQALDQFFNSGATDTNVRMLPLDSVRRLAEDGFDNSILGVNRYTALSNTQELNTTAELPKVVPLFDDTSIVPYTLEDVRMFVTLNGGLSGSNQSTLITVDPFTGQMERTVGQFGQPVGDVAMRRDGELFAYSLGPQTGGRTTANTGQYLNISPINAAATGAGDDGLTFQRNNDVSTNTENDPNGYFLINAMAFVPQGPTAGASIGNVPGIPDGERLFVVGDRLSGGRFGEVPLEYRENIVYSMVANNGAATNRGSTDGNLDRNFGAVTTPYIEPYGPASNKQEFGVVDVGQFIDSDPTKTGGTITGIALNQNLPGFFSQILFGVTDEGGLYSFNPSDSRTLDLSPTIGGTYSRIINSEFHGTVERHPEHFGFGAPEFASLTLGPRATEGGRYNSVFFATTTDGWIYTFQIDVNGVVEPAPVLVHGRSAVQIISALGFPVTIGRDVTGVAFSIREENPWHQTGDRNTPFSVSGPNTPNNLHGVFEPHNQTRIRTSGATSLYFGFEPTGDVADNTINNDGATGNLAPGGAHGTTVSRPFSLEDYSSADKPTLYFNYFLEVQGDDDATLTRQQLDSLRVFATGDDGQWQLLATNNSFRSFLNPDEYDYFAETGIPVQELYDDTNVWRQARIDLSPLAGNRNVQLRFDFSTAGGMQNQFRTTGYLTEIQAVPGTELVDGTGFSLTEQLVVSNNVITDFQFVRGASINIPAGASLFNGQVITVVGNAGAIALTLTLDPPTGPEQIQFNRTDTAAAIASRIAAALQLLDPSLQTIATGATVRIPEALSFQLTPERFAALEIEIPADVSSLLSQPLVLTDLLGNDTTVTLETVQDVSFTVGGQTVTVTANFTGFFDGFLIRFVNNPLLGDVPPTAALNFGQRTITVTYNSLAPTPTNSDFNAIVTALDNLAFFSAALTAGDGTVPFTPPVPAPQFPTGETYYSLTNTPEQVATIVANAINNSPRIQATANGREIVILGAAARVLSGGYIENSFNAGTTNSQLLPSGAYPIFYNTGMSDLEVRDAIRAALANGLGVQDAVTGISQATIDSYPGYATNRIRVFEQSLRTNNSAIGFSTFLPGDEFGSFGSTNISTDASTGALTRNAGTSNAIEGAYIDDIVIGFAGRGEMVLNAPAAQRNFVIDPTYRSVLTSDLHQPEYPDEVLVGGYTLEVRKGPTYGVPQDYDPIRLGLDEQFSWGRSFDINERLNPGAVTLLAPSGRELTDGQTFVISNGQRSLTFEFDSNGVVAQGRVRVPFIPLMTGTSFNHLTDDSAEVARAIRDAINSAQARTVLGITAAGGDSRETGPMTGNRIELFGEVIQINPSSGRFMTVDMVAESTGYGRETYRTFPLVDHANETVQNYFLLDPYTRARATQYLNNSTQFVLESASDTPSLANAVVTQYRDGQADTLVAKGKIGDVVVTGLGNELIPSDPVFDTDVVKIYLNAGDTIDALVETNRFNRGAPFRTPRVQIFADDAGNTELADSLTFDPLDALDPGNPFGTVNPVPFEELAIDARIESFLAPTSGYYFVAVSSIARLFGGFDPSELIGQYQLTVRPSGVVASEPVAVEYHLEGGDVNVFRPQGQLIIESNFISDFSQVGVNATYAGPPIPGIASVSPTQSNPGGVALLRNQNTDRLLPGTVITNNVITATQGTGIVFAGQTPVGGQAPAPVPFGRIVNNTVVGSGAGIGIDVTNSTSPTVLNNVISGFNIGLNIDASSSSTVENGNAFQNTTTASSRPLASQSFVIPEGVSLFEDPARRLYIPASGSQVIDSSFANLNDRATFFNTVKQPMGISASPILAPTNDAYGIPRVDDPNVTTPGGIGGNVFIDRGGIDRSDLVQPTVVLVSPIDFILGQGAQVPGGDNDPDASFVRLPENSGPVTFFEIQLLDPAGTGPDASTINENTVILTENGVTLVPGVDYTFGYSDNRRLIRLTPLSGLWRPDAVYEITLNNRDRVSLTLPRGEEITDGEQYIITDAQGRQSVFEFDSGFVMQVPQTLAIEVLGPNTFFNDGDVFTVVSPSGATRNFEINLSGAVASGNIPINLASAGTILEIRDVILAALAGVETDLTLAPVALTNESIQIGSLFGHTISGNVAGLRFFGVGGGVSVGDRFRYEAGNEDVLFEFTDGISPVAPGAVAIEIERTDSVDQIAEKIAVAVAGQSLGLGAARAIGDGRVVLGGTETDRLDARDSELEVVGVPGVTGPLQMRVSALATAADLEGSTFTILNGNVTVDFVLTTNPTLVTPNRRVVITPTATPQEIASAIAAEIVAGFSGALPATAQGRFIALNEQPSIIPPGTPQILTSVATSTPLLGRSGVSGGAIAVPFIPTRLFSPASAAAALTTAVATSPLQVTTFTPGGGTLLFGNTVLIERRLPGGASTTAGIPLPAVTDLAGNPIESNRNNDETRFTITMPEVRFDFGDAPVSYGTLLANNGARHSVGANATPRLGRVVDTEPDGQPFTSDDVIMPVMVTSPGGSPLFSFSTLPPVGTAITISSTVTPTSGDRITVTVGSDSATFELVAPGVASLTGNIPVALVPTDTPMSIAEKLAAAISGELAPTGRAVRVEVDAVDPIIRIETLDDEDGVAVGQITVGVQSYFVFLDPSADQTAPTPDDVLGFLNPLDPSGTSVAVTVTGAGLLDAWVDFNGDGTFDPTREQVLQNKAVVDGVNIVNIATPADAVPGTTWIRFRLSTTGNLRPTGSAVGGEVEDYQVSIIPVAPFLPVNDRYTTVEDVTLVVTPTSPDPTLLDNDLNLISPFLPPRAVIVDQPANGTVTITDALTGSFNYVPNPAFNGTDTFTYRLSSEGDARGAAPNATIATVTITVTPVNDAPVATVLSPIDLLERDDAAVVTVPGVITGALPGRPEATDELASQTITITINSAASTIPAGLFQTAPSIVPILDAGGVLVGADLRFVQRPDAFGTALVVINVRDNHPTNPRTTANTVTLNIRPVNDAPQVNPALLGATDNQGPDNVYSVNNGSDPTTAAGTITYTLAEDQKLFIPLRRPTGVIGFNRVGLLDVFTVGPNNETLPVEGGNQVLNLLDIPTRTRAGGTLTPVIVGGQFTGFDYQPPVDFNSDFGGLDSFVYSVIDDNPLGGETWDLAAGGLIDDTLVTQGLVQLRINPVNDRPQFEMATNSVSVLEDSGAFRLNNFTFNIFAGPPSTAFDEIDPATGQSVTFSVSGLNPVTSQLFAVAPTVSPAGVLTFTPAPNAFGTAVLEVRATDNGPDNAIRGDEVSSLAQTLTINIRPVNDRPELNTTTPISYTLNEDSAILQSGNTVTFQGVFIPLNGTGGQVGLLDVFNPGPANESSNVTPGGNQTLQLATPIPASTAQGGTLSRVFDPLNPSVLIGLRYTPRANFNGTDSFIYGVRDDGVSSDLNGVVSPDPREAFNTVTLNVLALNDRPQFSGPLSVTVDEDATTTSTIGQTIVTNFVTDIAAGPAGAVDELDPVTGQTVSFVVTPVAGNPANLFLVPPTVSSTGTLTFRTVADANGVAVFTIFAEDNGPNNPPLEFNTSTPPRTFTITVNPVNDVPTFVPVLTQVEVLEDSGPFTTSEPYATQISPGPADEVAAGQTVRFEVTVPTEGQSLFQTLPSVTDNGFLRFTPRDNAVGTTVVSVVAIDSEGARSAPASLTITLLEVNDVPVAGNVSFNSDEDTVLTVPRQSLLAVAVDPDLETNPNEVLRLTGVSLTSQNGATITILPSGDIQYDPTQAPLIQALRAGQILPDTFTYRLIDAADAVSNIATVTINVTGVNDAPTVRDDFVTLPLSGAATIRPLDNDFDIDGIIDTSSLEITLLPALGSVQVRPDGTIIYTPFDNFRGTDTIRYTVRDTLGARSEQATITIDMNLPPLAVNDITSTFRDRAVEINVAENDSDPDGQLDLDSIRIVTQPTRGSAIVLGGGIVRYLPGSDFIGVDTFEYTINDLRGRPSNVGQVRIQVVASELQNPSNFFDVNVSGETSPLDALLILNRLARASREGMGASIPVEQLINEVPKLFYDVDGSRVVEPRDALAVINEIARQNRRALSEGEQVTGAAAVPFAPFNPIATGFASATRVDDFESVYGPIAAAGDADTLAADFGLPEDDVINTLAIDNATKEAEKRRSELLDAIDAAWTDASQF